MTEDWCHWKPGPASKGRELKKISRVRVRVESPCGMKVDLKKTRVPKLPDVINYVILQTLQRHVSQRHVTDMLSMPMSCSSKLSMTRTKLGRKADLGKDGIGLVVQYSNITQQCFHSRFALLQCNPCFQAYTVTDTMHRYVNDPVVAAAAVVVVMSP